MSTKSILIQVVAITALAGAARAEDPPAPAVVPAAPEAAAPVPAETAVANATITPAAAPTPPPPPYSIPWQLRPVAAANVVRSDTAVAFYDNGAGANGSTVATMLLGSYKLTPSLAPLVRLGFVQNDAPATGADGTSFVNPIVGATYARKIAALRWAAFLGATIPIAIAANGARVAGTGMLAHWWGPDAAQGFFHEFSGWVVFVVSLAMVFVIHRTVLAVAPALSKA